MDNTMHDVLRNHVRSLRETHGLSQVALAQASGISRQTLSAIEAGRSEPSASIALRIASVLGCRFEDAFFSEERNLLEAELDELPTSHDHAADQRLVLANLHGRWVGYELSGHGPSEALCAADGVVTARSRGRRVQLEALRTTRELRDNIVLP
ncbi:MAG TPA: helix-turn-helix transcriptional regulator [Polyangiales bacterium]